MQKTKKASRQLPSEDAFVQVPFYREEQSSSLKIALYLNCENAYAGCVPSNLSQWFSLICSIRNLKAQLLCTALKRLAQLQCVQVGAG